MNINISQMKQRYNMGCETGTEDTDNANIHKAFILFLPPIQEKKRKVHEGIKVSTI